jgi:hypothetical protein
MRSEPHLALYKCLEEDVILSLKTRPASLCLQVIVPDQSGLLTQSQSSGCTHTCLGDRSPTVSWTSAFLLLYAPGVVDLGKHQQPLKWAQGH